MSDDYIELFPLPSDLNFFSNFDFQCSLNELKVELKKREYKKDIVKFIIESYIFNYYFKHDKEKIKKYELETSPVIITLSIIDIILSYVIYGKIIIYNSSNNNHAIAKLFNKTV